MEVWQRFTKHASTWAMRRSIQFITPSEALRRVFLSYLKDTSTRTYSTCPNTKHLPIPSRCLSSLHPSPLSPQHHPRPASTTSPTPILRSFGPKPPNPTAFGPKKDSSTPDRRPRDEQISAYMVHMVQPSDGRLSEPQILSEVLSSRERDDKGRLTQFVQEVSPPAGPDRPYPVCRMYDKKAAREAEEARQKAAKAVKRANRQSKQLDLSWAMSDNDLGHRMARLKEFLQKGWRVDVCFGTQRRSGWSRKRGASEEEARGVVEKIRSAVGEVEGAQEKEMQGEVGKEAVLSFEGKAKK